MISESEAPTKQVIPNFHPLAPIPATEIHVDDENLYEFDPIQREVFRQNKQNRLAKPREKAAPPKKSAEVSTPSQQTPPLDGWDGLRQVNTPIIGALSTKRKNKKIDRIQK